MSPGQTRCSASICGSDVDWFGFDYPASATVTITFNHAAGDLDLEIYSSLTLAYLSGSYGTSNSETVTLSGLPAGYYWARVYGYSGAENPDYCITVN